MWKILLIGAFGGAGAILRYLISSWSVHWFGTGFPIGTLLVNVVGCFLLGLLYAVTETTALIPSEWRHGLGVGFLGGLTTFSTFGYETHHQLQNSLWRHAATNVLLNVALGLVAVWAGISIAKFITAQV
ncbi:MAG: fluoride efflux transporter CrcB [Planctomycetes bacterium]|nr:fluoride efflux transporter CrcB [Planctomycetota bacterium]MBL7044634.1 fluoride efflux transporter CrcB [Pirellulaceae bacterium]